MTSSVRMRWTPEVLKENGKRMQYTSAGPRIADVKATGKRKRGSEVAVQTKSGSEESDEGSELTDLEDERVVRRGRKQVGDSQEREEEG